MDSRISQFIYRYSARDQVKILLLTLLAFPILYLSLELPKTIINEAIGGGEATELFGNSWQPVEYLLLLCSGLLLAVVVNGLLKMRINTYKGIIGERMVRRLRYQLLERVLRFPPSQFHRVSQGEIIATVTSETEPLAGFIGDSVAQPLFQGGTMLTILIFMFVQDPVLGLVAVSMIPLQAVIIPRMQKRLNLLKKQRVSEVRVLAGMIGESVDGNQEIRLYGTQGYHLAHFSSSLGRLFGIRLNIFKQKFLMKFINNFLNQLPPIMFYAVGGVLVIKGQLSIGALVAALAAYKDLVSPWKELLAYYQQAQDAKTRYEQILEHFDPPGLQQLVTNSADEPSSIAPQLELQNLYLKDDRGEYATQRVDLLVNPGEVVAFHSHSTVLLRQLARALTGVEAPAIGQVSFGSEPVSRISTERLTGGLSYVGPEPFMFAGTVMQNINYGLRRLAPSEDDIELSPERRWEISEAKASGNSAANTEQVWTDFAMAGIESWQQMRFLLQDLLTAIGSRDLVFEFGLRDRYDPEKVAPVVSEKFVEVRKDLVNSMVRSALVEPLEFKRYHSSLSVLENLGFGMLDSELEKQHIKRLCANNSEFIQLLHRQGIYQSIRQAGEQFALKLVEKIADAGPKGQLPEAYARFDDPDIRQSLVDCIGHPEHLPPCELVVAIALQLRLDQLDEQLLPKSLQQQIVDARQRLWSSGEMRLFDSLEPLYPDRVNKHLTVMENLVWGIPSHGSDSPLHQRLVNEVERVLKEHQAESLVLVVISLSQVGIRGERLSLFAKQNIQLLRALMKRPKVLVLHDAIEQRSLAEQQALLVGIKKMFPELTILLLKSGQVEPMAGVRHWMFDAKGAQLVIESGVVDSNQLQIES